MSGNQTTLREYNDQANKKKLGEPIFMTQSFHAFNDPLMFIQNKQTSRILKTSLIIFLGVPQRHRPTGDIKAKPTLIQFWGSNANFARIEGVPGKFVNLFTMSNTAVDTCLIRGEVGHRYTDCKKRKIPTNFKVFTANVEAFRKVNDEKGGL